jgi:hypothetical protein
MFDWSLSFGNFLTILTMVLGGAGFVYTMRGRLDALSERLFEVEKDVKSLVGVLIEQGRISERISAVDSRIQSQGQRLDDLKIRFDNWVDWIAQKNREAKIDRG